MSRKITLVPKQPLRAIVQKPGERRVIQAPRSTFISTVQKFGGRVTSIDPIIVKNQIREIRNIDDIPGINGDGKVDGASIIWNANTQQYDVKLLSEFPTANIGTATITTLIANSTPGEPGQVLISNGTTVYWGDSTGIDDFTYESSTNTLKIIGSDSQEFVTSIDQVNNFTITGDFDFHTIDGGEY